MSAQPSPRPSPRPEHVGPLLKLHADALAKAGAVPANGPKLTRAIVAACERTGVAPADIGV